MLFTMTENPDLLSPHARQQYSLVKGENISSMNSWIKSLSWAVYGRLNSDASMLLHESDQHEGNSENYIIDSIAIKLAKLAQHLDLIKYNKKGHLSLLLNQYHIKQLKQCMSFVLDHISVSQLNVDFGLWFRQPNKETFPW